MFVGFDFFFFFCILLHHDILTSYYNLEQMDPLRKKKT